MEKEKSPVRTIKQLQTRKKYASIILLILIVAMVLDGSILIYNLVTGNGFLKTLFVAMIACMVVFIPIYLGKKKIEAELKDRERGSSDF